MVVYPLEIGGFPPKARTVINKLAVNFARGKINERHNSLRIEQTALYNTRPLSSPTRRHPLSSHLTTRWPLAEHLINPSRPFHYLANVRHLGRCLTFA